ncbi:hypothetical protein Tco_0204989 [Tanacetum coccineum]
MAAINNVPQLVDKKGGSYAAIAPKLEPKKFNKWKKQMLCYLAGMEPYYLKFIKDGPFQPKTAEGDDKPNLPKKWLTFSQGLRSANHTQTLDLADIYERFVYEDNLFQIRYSDTKKALITTLSSTAISTTFFSNNVIRDIQENSDDEVDERSSEEYLRDLDIECLSWIVLEELFDVACIVMTDPVIPILSDSSEESVGSHVPRVILFGTIPTSIPVIPVVLAEVPIVPVDPLVTSDMRAVSVISPTRVLDLVDYSSSSDSDPTKYSLPLAPELPLVSPFLCSDDSEVDSESEHVEQRPERHGSLAVHKVMVLRWRDMVVYRSSSPSRSLSFDTFTPSFAFPVAPVVAPLGIHHQPVILIRPGEAIPFGRPYRTHRNGPRKLLTARKIVGPFPAHRLAWRGVSHRSLDRHSSPDFTSYSTSSGTSSDSSLVHSLGRDTLDQTHSGPSTKVASSRSAPMSTPYPPMTSESSPDLSSDRSLDSSSLFAGPSRKRCRSPTTLVPSSTPVSRSIVPTHADLLPPRKRFRDSYSPEDSREDHIEIGTTDAKAVVDLGIGDRVRVDAKDGIGMGVEIAASDIREDEEEFEAEASAGGMMEIVVDPLVTGGISESTRGDAPDLVGTLYDIAHYMLEVPLDRITEFKTAQRQLEAGQLMASG